ncbi:MAG: amylo-alpha-1,6-glucosidase [Actinomycetota bacterium]|nr:amylo-alpha-1,6-glucosidase [Actinomycetota bacterium]
MTTAPPYSEPPGHGLGSVTLVEGSTFAISGRSGDMDADSPQGLFFCDTRILSNWKLRVDGHTPQPLAVLASDPYRATFLARALPGGAPTDLLVERKRYVGQGMREDLSLRNLGAAPATVRISLTVGADFADVFAVKEGRVVQRRSELSTSAEGNHLIVGIREGAARRKVRISAGGAVADRQGLHFSVSLPPRGAWRTEVLVVASIGDEEFPVSFPVDRPVDQSHPAQRMRSWRGSRLRIETQDSDLQRTLLRSVDDIGALRIVDPDYPDEVAVAAGAPWFMALFGRDSLLTSYMALPLDSRLALGTLRALARSQGRREDPGTEEQPGRILHETRLGLDFPLTRGSGGQVYYGTADATPLFVVLLGELRRWGAAHEDIEALLPHADRALQWVENYGDRDGDGLVEYHRMTDRGLANQGWKDSHDGINFADGSLAASPIALCEVQGYVYAAYLARAEIADAAGDKSGAQRWSRRAAELKTQFNAQFWLADQGWFAIGLDRDKRPIDALASNMGHCLWSGIVDEEKAHVVAERLMSPQMFTGWGVRTLASSMGAYNPMSYHNGSVWPHDSALVASGLMRYRFVESAQRIAAGLLEAAAYFDGRLPELMCGFDRSEYPEPVAYPTSCSPQAWASAAPVQLVRMLLGLDPLIPEGLVRLGSAWPEQYGPITIRHMSLAGAAATLRADTEVVALTGLPDDIAVRSPGAL